jgi:hypothetical protein
VRNVARATPGLCPFACEWAFFMGDAVFKLDAKSNKKMVFACLNSGLCKPPVYLLWQRKQRLSVT